MLRFNFSLLKSVLVKSAYFPSLSRRGPPTPLLQEGGGFIFKILYFYISFIFLMAVRLKNIHQLRDYRKKLRRNSTSAEAAMWNLLKGKKLNGRKFRRQYSISRYILDFYCVSEQLAIELDGDPHGDYVIMQRDEQREKYLKAIGIKVLRFENRFVFQEPEMVIDIIRKQFKRD